MAEADDDNGWAGERQGGVVEAEEGRGGNHTSIIIICIPRNRNNAKNRGKFSWLWGGMFGIISGVNMITVILGVFSSSYYYKIIPLIITKKLLRVWALIVQKSKESVPKPK